MCVIVPFFSSFFLISFFPISSVYGKRHLNNRNNVRLTEKNVSLSTDEKNLTRTEHPVPVLFSLENTNEEPLESRVTLLCWSFHYLQWDEYTKVRWVSVNSYRHPVLFRRWLVSGLLGRKQEPLCKTMKTNTINFLV